MRALLVVPHDNDRAHLEQSLVARGWDVIAARTADEALLIHRVAPASLIIAEQSADGSASWLFRSIRHNPAGHPPYLLGLARPGDEDSLSRLGDSAASDVLHLPLLDGALSARLPWIEAVLRSENRPALKADAPAPGERLDELHRQFDVQQAFLEELFESAPEGVVIVDADDRVVRINSEFTRVFGYTLEEAQGRPLNDLIVPPQLREEGEHLDVVVRQGERVMIETVRRHKDGTLIDVSLLATQIDVNGPVGAFGIYRDITEMKQRTAALKASEERYRALFDQSPVGVLLCDRRLRITHCNEALTRIVDASYEQLIGSHLVGLRDRRLIPGLREALRGRPAFYQGPFRSWTGRQRHVSIQYAPLRDENGEVIGGMGVLEDISDRVTAEQQLQAHAAEMERVNAALRERTLELEAAMQSRSRLYTAMNHELRTPISSILLYQELLIAGSLGELNDQQQLALESSHTATQHLLDLVRDILDLSKIEAGRVSVEPREVRTAALLNELRSSVAPLCARYGSALSLVIEDEVGTINTDPQRVRQILLNFVSNAAKYGRGEPIEIRARRPTPEHDLIIEVVDQGVGIGPEDLSHIFEDFVQVGVSKDEGTGLGLAISRRLADLLGARLEVESDLGVGSTFRLVLPAEASVDAECG